ncbi:MAG: hypothetical protein ACHQAY_07570 [Hyphomicrobiales bacterium]
MDKESVVAKLRGTGFQVHRIVRMGDNDGWRFTLTNGAVIHCFDDGRIIVHGPSAASLRFIVRAKSLANTPWSRGQPQSSLHLS